MSLQCCCIQILIVLCYFHKWDSNNQVEARTHLKKLNHWVESYEQNVIQETDETLTKLNDSLEKKIKQQPKVKVKKWKKNKGKLTRKKDLYHGHSVTISKTSPKHKRKSNRKKKKTFKKFVKAIDDRNKDSNMSTSKQLGTEDDPVDITVHIKLKN